MRADAEKPVYFVNVWADVLLIGGLSIAASMVCLGLQIGRRDFGASEWAMALAWAVNWPHFAATSYRLYRSRASMGQYPATALGVPLLVLAGTIAAFLQPQSVAPALIKLFLWWSPFHFSGQTLGITLLYARRAGMTVGRLDRAAIAGFIYATYAWVVVAMESDFVPDRMGAILFPRLGLPGWVLQVAQAALYVSMALLLLVYGRASARQRRWIPPIVLLPALAQFVWFVVGARVATFNLFVPLFHSLQYLVIAWALQLKERQAETGAAPSRSFVLRETLPWAAINVVLGGILFWLLPRLAATAGYPLAFCVPVLSAAVQIHHFFVDGVIWKLRNPTVGRPLEVSLGELAGGRTSA